MSKLTKLLVTFLLFLSMNIHAITKNEVKESFSAAEKRQEILNLDRCYDIVNRSVKNEMKHRIQIGDVYKFYMAIIVDYLDKEDTCSTGRIVDGLVLKLKKDGFQVASEWVGVTTSFAILVIEWR